MLFRNTLAQSLGQGVAYLCSFVLAPLMLARLGLSVFGVWAATGGLVAWIGILDFGITGSLARFVAYEHGRDDSAGIQETIGLGVLVIGVISLLALAAALLAAGPLSAAIGTLSAGQMRSVLVACVVVMATQGGCAVVSAIPIGMSRMVGINGVYIAASLINLGFSVAALVLSRSLVVYAWANAAAEAIAFLITYIAVRRIWRDRVARRPSRARGVSVLRFAATAQVNGLATLVNGQTDKIVLAVAIGPSAAGAYEVANRVVLAINSTSNLCLSGMIPMLTTRVVREGRSFFTHFYAEYTGRTCALAFPIYGIAGVAIVPLMRAWLGTVPKHSVLVFAVLLGAYLLNATTGVGTSLANADGHPGLYARPAAWSAVLNIILTIVLASIFGFDGVLAGTAVAIGFSAVFFVVTFHRKYGITPGVYLTSISRPLLVSGILAIPAVVGADLLYRPGSSRIGALAVAVTIGGSYGLAVWLASSRLRLLPRRLTMPIYRVSRSGE